MQRFKILHRTYYNFAGSARLGPHTLLLRPREGHELRVEHSTLTITPAATIRWHRDVEDNSVAIATFDTSASQLSIESEVIVQQFNQAPLDFVVSDYAQDYPFAYRAEDEPILAPYRDIVTATPGELAQLDEWVRHVWTPNERIETYTLLERLTSRIQQTLSYRSREEPGVQAPAESLSLATGSCRDLAFLFMAAARRLGLAARFVSGYSNSPASTLDFGSTHAWAEVFLPGAGWKGFDPTLGELVGANHIPVAVARLPDAVPPVAGSFTGLPGTRLDVGVWVTPLPTPGGRWET